MLNQLQECIDYDHLDALRFIEKASEDNLIDSMLTIWHHQAPFITGQMEIACHKGDKIMLSNLAHTMKSSAGNLGMTAISELCQRIEAEGRKSQSDFDFERTILQIKQLILELTPIVIAYSREQNIGVA